MKLTEFDMQKFCSEDSTRIQISKPFCVGDYVYATDGAICIEISKEFYDGQEYPIGIQDIKEKGLDSHFTNDQVFFDFPFTQDFEKPCPQCGGNLAGALSEDCPECDGEGEITFENEYNEYDGIECKSCRGHGVLKSCGCCYNTGTVYRDIEIAPIEKTSINKINGLYLEKIKSLPGIKFGFVIKNHGLSFIFDYGRGIIMACRGNTWSK